MWLQPLIYFSAVIWALAFAAFGIYVAVRPATVSITDRVVGLFASFLVGGLGAAIMIGAMYLIEELV
jgi:uncharacterized membrane protein required for colicin V production